MLTWLTAFSGTFSPLNLFRYLTFRTIGATGTAALFVFFFGPAIIAALAEPDALARVASAIETIADGIEARERPASPA